MRKASYSTYEIRVRAVEAVRRGMTIGEVAKAYQAHRATIHRWLVRYRQSRGYRGLVRRPVSGRPRLMTGLKATDWRAIVRMPASDFGYETDFWTCRRLYQVLHDQLHVAVSVYTVWRRLREAGLTYQKPERRYFQANRRLRQEWLRKEWPQILETVRKYKAILYFEDEAHLALIPVLAKTWAPEGKTPKQSATGKRGGLAAMSALTPRGGLIFSILDKRIKSPEVIHFLKQMLNHHKRRHLVVVMDNAPPHVSKMTSSFIAAQPRLHVFHFPSHSPDWNPDEYVWNHLKHQELKGHKAKTKVEFKALAKKSLRKMANDSHQLRGIFFRCCIAELLQ